MNSDVTPIDSASRCPLLLLIVSGVLWLLVSGVFSLIHFAQVLNPGIFADCPFLTFGHIATIAENTFIYGWLANAGLALALWILARLGGEPVRAQNWVLAGTAFWNFGVTLGVVGIAIGDGSGYPLLGFPGYVQPLLLASYCAIAVAGVVAWGGRVRPVTYASQWYAAAALFLFPWFFSIAQVMLFFAPVRGVLQAVVASWYGQALWSLWMAPLGLGVAYYVIPKITGRTLRSYEFAALGFWSLIFIGPWTGGRHLIAGPVPAWIPTIGIVCLALMLFHYAVIVLNLVDTSSTSGTAGKFIGFGLLAYVGGGLIDCITGFHGVAVVTEFTHVEEAIKQLAFYGAGSMLLLGGLYYAVPRIVGRPWAMGGLVGGHVGCAVAGTVVLVLSLGVAGLVQGGGLLSAQMPFEQISILTDPWLFAAAVGECILLLGNGFLAANLVATLACTPGAETAPVHAAASLEASAP